jgi:hypothetical protein
MVWKDGTKSVDCPFPPCLRQWWVAISAPAVVPVHAPDLGGRKWVGGPAHCPGSFTLYMDGSDCESANDLVERDRERVIEVYRRYLAQLNAEAEEMRREAADAKLKARQPHPDGGWGHGFGYPIGRPVDPDTEHEEVFPGRPADAVEPGTGEVAGEIPPLPLIADGKTSWPEASGQRYGQPLGRAEMDSGREQTAALIHLTKNKIGEATDVMASLVNHLEVCEALTVQVGVHIDASLALARAAVGSGGANQDAIEMKNHILTAWAMAGTDNNEIQAAITRAAERQEKTLKQLLAAVQAANRYLAAIG